MPMAEALAHLTLSAANQAARPSSGPREPTCLRSGGNDHMCHMGAQLPQLGHRKKYDRGLKSPTTSF